MPRKTEQEVENTAESRTQYSETQLVATWERFLKKYAKQTITDAVLEYPQKRSVTVKFLDVDRHDHELAEYLVSHPYQAIRAAEAALKMVDAPWLTDERPTLRFRFEGLPESYRIGIRNLRAEDLGRVVALEGIIKRTTEVRPRLEDAVFECLRCKANIKVSQDEHLTFKEPYECFEEQGGCGRSPGFKLIQEASRFIDQQRVEIQESFDNLRGGDQPQKINIYCEEDLVGRFSPGDRVVANGVLRSSQRKLGGAKSTVFDLHVEGIGIELQREEYEDVKVSPEDEVAIQRLSEDPDLYQKMIDSMAPSIYGMREEKEALVLQLYGGVRKKLPDGNHLRGDIHILLVGDPGVAKSQLLRYASSIAPRGIYTSGKSSSAAGLTAAAVRDEQDGRWALEAGALVLADGGIACIDEMDKMEENDTSSMHEAMEQQTISVAKAGITAQLRSRCSILGAANPKLGRFDPFKNIAEQIDMDPPLLSRFDVIFPLTDKPEPKRDTALATHVLSTHRAGEIIEYRKAKPEGAYSDADEERALMRVKPPIERSFLRKYVAHAKTHCFPVMQEETLERIRDYYVNLRRQAGAEAGERGPVPMTPRQLEAIVRLAESSARVRLSNEVRIQDVDRAINIVEYYLRKVSGGTGVMDIDVIATGISHDQRERINIISDIIRGLEVGRDGAPYSEIIAEAERRGIPLDKARETVFKLKERGNIYEPRADHFRMTHTG